MVSKVNIEVMIDTNANSRRLDDVYDGLREAADQQESSDSRALSEFRDYLKQANQRGRTRYEVTQRDTAQIFHEKTNLMTPELAKQAGQKIYPRFVRENLEQGHYHVEPPIHGEEEYYDALETFMKAILPEKSPEDAERLAKVAPQDRVLLLQELYLGHMASTPLTDWKGLPRQYRTGKYEQAFADYREVRFNAGEITAMNFLRNHPLPPEGERTAFVFVSSDQWANEEMAKARQGKNDQGRFEVFTVSPNNFRQLIEQVIRDIERDQPDMRHVRKAYRELSRITDEGPAHDVFSQGKDNGGLSGVMKATGIAAAPAPRPAVAPEARKFADFVSRVAATERDGGPAR